MPSLLHEISTQFKTATLGMGCFWACDALYGAQQGVLRTRVGYSGGTTVNPTYKQMGDHTEVIEIDYDPKTISFDKILELFWANHEYGVTTKIKRQYTSLILYHDEEQKRVAEKSLNNETPKHTTPLVTEIIPASIFYPAEDYHQKYRLQQHKWLYQELELTPELLQNSHLAARLNGYLAGVGELQDFDKDVVEFGLGDKVGNFVRAQLQENYGATLYC